MSTFKKRHIELAMKNMKRQPLSWMKQYGTPPLMKSCDNGQIPLTTPSWWEPYGQIAAGSSRLKKLKPTKPKRPMMTKKPSEMVMVVDPVFKAALEDDAKKLKQMALAADAKLSGPKPPGIALGKKKKCKSKEKAWEKQKAYEAKMKPLWAAANREYHKYQRKRAFVKAYKAQQAAKKAQQGKEKFEIFAEGFVQARVKEATKTHPAKDYLVLQVNEIPLTSDWDGAFWNKKNPKHNFRPGDYVSGQIIFWHEDDVLKAQHKVDRKKKKRAILKGKKEKSHGRDRLPF